MQITQTQDLLPLPQQLEPKIKRKNQVSSLCFMQENSVLWPRTTTLKHTYKECNAGLQNWRKFVRKCKIRWPKCWDQNHQAIWIPNHCLDFARNANVNHTYLLLIFYHNFQHFYVQLNRLIISVYLNIYIFAILLHGTTVFVNEVSRNRYPQVILQSKNIRI